eukprot:m.253444 g.253444  ORF g.253444 m.253444 type:complete len:312 (-) comp26718_c0_seq13:41-976(-)
MTSLRALRAQHASVSLSGKRAVIVGGTSGIGKGLALRMAAANASVTIVGRSAQRGNAVVEEMKAQSSSSEVQHEFIPCDSLLLKNIRTFAQDFAARSQQVDNSAKSPDNGIDYLVLCQSIATTQGFTPTSEGLDEKMTLHYWGRMAFIQELMPLMKGREARVMSVLSAGFHSPYRHFKEDPELKTHYSMKVTPDATSLYNDCGMDALARENPDMSFMHVAPGFIKTRWGTEMPWFIRGPVRFMQLFARSPEDCAEYLSEGFFSDQFKTGFHMLDQYGRATPKPMSVHEEARDFIYDYTKKLIARVYGEEEK